MEQAREGLRKYPPYENYVEKSKDHYDSMLWGFEDILWFRRKHVQLPEPGQVEGSDWHMTETQFWPPGEIARPNYYLTGNMYAIFADDADLTP